MRKIVTVFFLLFFELTVIETSRVALQLIRFIIFGFLIFVRDSIAPFAEFGRYGAGVVHDFGIVIPPELSSQR